MASKSDKPEGEETQNTPVEEALAESQAGGVIDAIDRNRKQILIVIVGAAVVIGAVLISRQVETQKHLEAGAAFSKAAASRDIAALDGVLVEYPESIAAGNALLTKADIQIDQGKAKDAQTTLESFVNDFKSHPQHAQGLFALANVLHIAGDKEKAKTYYEQTISEQPDGELAPLSRIRLGDLALESGDKDTADQQYQDSFIKHPGNPFTSLAEEKIALIKIGNPPVVDRPKPPAPPKKEEAPKPAAPKKPKVAVPAKKAPVKPATTKPKAAKPKKAPAPKPVTKPKPAPVKKATPPAPAKPAANPKPPVKPAPKPQPKPATPPPAPKTPAPSGN